MKNSGPIMRTMPNGVMFSHVAALLAEGESVEVRVMGNSMFPTLRSGSRIVLQPLSGRDLRRGTIVFARVDAGHWAVHRILSVRGDRVVLMGDGNVVGKEHVSAADILGCMPQSRLGYLWGLFWLAVRPVRRIFVPAMYRLGVLKR